MLFNENTTYMLIKVRIRHLIPAPRDFDSKFQQLPQQLQNFAGLCFTWFELRGPASGVSLQVTRVNSIFRSYRRS